MLEKVSHRTLRVPLQVGRKLLLYAIRILAGIGRLLRLPRLLLLRLPAENPVSNDQGLKIMRSPCSHSPPAQVTATRLAITVKTKLSRSRGQVAVQCVQDLIAPKRPKLPEDRPIQNQGLNRRPETRRSQRRSTSRCQMLQKTVLQETLSLNNSPFRGDIQSMASTQNSMTTPRMQPMTS